MLNKRSSLLILCFLMLPTDLKAKRNKTEKPGPTDTDPSYMHHWQFPYNWRVRTIYQEITTNRKTSDVFERDVLKLPLFFEVTFIPRPKQTEPYIMEYRVIDKHKKTIAAIDMSVSLSKLGIKKEKCWIEVGTTVGMELVGYTFEGKEYETKAWPKDKPKKIPVSAFYPSVVFSVGNNYTFCMLAYRPICLKPKNISGLGFTFAGNGDPGNTEDLFAYVSSVSDEEKYIDSSPDVVSEKKVIFWVNCALFGILLFTTVSFGLVFWLTSKTANDVRKKST